MTALVAVETVLLVLLAALVVGLLRSHAEILRRLEAGGGVAEPQRPARDLALAEPRDDVPAPADVTGATLRGDAVQLAVTAPGTRTLLAFLTSGCTICGGFWQALRDEPAPDGVRVVAVTRGPEMESPAKLRELAPDGLAVVMSSQAWDDYRVPLAPYFVLVSGESGTIEGEGAARTWDQVSSLLRDALLDAEDAARRMPDDHDRVERELAAAGIRAGDPSLYRADDAEEV